MASKSVNLVQGIEAKFARRLLGLRPGRSYVGDAERSLLGRPRSPDALGLLRRSGSFGLRRIARMPVRARARKGRDRPASSAVLADQDARTTIASTESSFSDCPEFARMQPKPAASLLGLWTLAWSGFRPWRYSLARNPPPTTIPAAPLGCLHALVVCVTCTRRSSRFTRRAPTQHTDVPARSNAGSTQICFRESGPGSPNPAQ